MKPLILCLICAAALSACFKDETIFGQTDTSDTWLLRAINGNPVSSRITLTFPKHGQIAGQAPCNSYGAAQTAPLPWFEVGPIRATKRACPALKLETQYFTALAKMTLIELRETSLLLSSDKGQTLTFTKE